MTKQKMVTDIETGKFLWEIQTYSIKDRSLTDIEYNKLQDIVDNYIEKLI